MRKPIRTIKRSAAKSSVSRAVLVSAVKSAAAKSGHTSKSESTAKAGSFTSKAGSFTSKRFSAAKKSSSGVKKKTGGVKKKSTRNSSGGTLNSKQSLSERLIQQMVHQPSVIRRPESSTAKPTKSMGFGVGGR
jgi:hypothetical protein